MGFDSLKANIFWAPTQGITISMLVMKKLRPSVVNPISQSSLGPESGSKSSR